MNKTYVYIAIFTYEQDGGYSVRFPQLDGCFAQGDNFEIAYNNASEALCLHLCGMIEDGKVLPKINFEVELGHDETAIPVAASIYIK